MAQSDLMYIIGYVNIVLLIYKLTPTSKLNAHITVTVKCMTASIKAMNYPYIYNIKITEDETNLCKMILCKNMSCHIPQYILQHLE